MVSDPIYAMKREMLRRGMSHRTVCTYVQCVRQFMRFCKKDMLRVTKKDAREYLDRIVDRKRSGSTLNVHLNALKFLLQEVLGKRVMLKFRYSKAPKKLPVFLTKDETHRLIEAVGNPVHRLIVELLYSAGLRVSEVVNLRGRDLEFQRKVGWVRKGKGGKDRPFIIAEFLTERLKGQVEMVAESGGVFVFSGRKGRHLSVRSVQEIVRKGAKKAGIRKKVHPHSLRHSFATHLIENGNDIVTVQPLLGHNSAETTNTYVHMARPLLLKVRSPYDLER